MLRILNTLSEVSEKIGLERFYFGHIEELINMLNVEGKQNITHLPALFLPMDLRYTHPDTNTFGVRLDVLIAVQSDNRLLPTDRFAQTMVQLDVYRAKFEKALRVKTDTMTNISGVLRPKVADVWNNNTKNKVTFNEALDGIEIICDITYNGNGNCPPLKFERGIFSNVFSSVFA